jgi:hypothetical protein
MAPANQASIRAKQPVVSVNIPLPVELHRRLKMVAAAEGLTVKEAVITACEMWVSNG